MHVFYVLHLEADLKLMLKCRKKLVVDVGVF
jgi:hypothetical protein